MGDVVAGWEAGLRLLEGRVRAPADVARVWWAGFDEAIGELVEAGWTRGDVYAAGCHILDGMDPSDQASDFLGDYVGALMGHCEPSVIPRYRSEPANDQDFLRYVRGLAWRAVHLVADSSADCSAAAGGVVWSEIVSLVGALSPDVRDTLNPPAHIEEIAGLGRHLAAALPAGYREYLHTFDGQNTAGRDHPFIGNNRLLPIAEVIALRDSMLDMFGEEDPIETVTGQRVQPVLWDSLWIPLSEWEGQPGLILDLHPGPAGTYGQIWQWWPGVDLGGEDLILAPDLASFAAELLHRLQDHEFQLGPGGQLQPTASITGQHWLI